MDKRRKEGAITAKAGQSACRPRSPKGSDLPPHNLNQSPHSHRPNLCHLKVGRRLISLRYTPPTMNQTSAGTRPSSFPSHHPPSDYAHHDSAAQATAAAALSHQDEDASPSSANGRKRKATSQPGSRGVANLTPEQLAKKRANDREAQRAIRERTRNTIESLANRIKELESQQPFQELQKAIAERDAARAESEELRKKLATVASVVNIPQEQRQVQQHQQQQPNLHGTFDGFEEFIDSKMLTEINRVELAALTAQQSPLPPLNASAGSQPYPLAHQSPVTTNSGYDHQQHIHPDLRSPQTASHPSPASQSGRTDTPTYASESTSLRRWSPSLEQPPNHPPYQSSNGVSYDQRLPPRAPMQSQSNGERLDLAYVLEPTHSNRTSPVSGGPTSAPYHSPPPTEPPLYMRKPRNRQPTCPLDSLLLDFLAGRYAQLSAGVPMHEVVGPEYPSLLSLADPDAPQQSHSFHPVSAFLFDILSKFPDISKVPEKVAVLYIMFLILRWQICPCQSCYERLPHWTRPTTGQMNVEHAAWFDHVPW